MRIDEIISERGRRSYDAVTVDQLEDEFDEQFPSNLPQFALMSKQAVVARAIQLAKDPKVGPGRAIYLAVRQVYPDLDQDAGMHQQPSDNTSRRKSKKPSADTEEPKKAVVPSKKLKKPDNTGVGMYEPKLKRGWNQSTHRNKSFKGDGKGSMSKLAKKLNPVSDIDTTDIGTAVASAAAKAKSSMRNRDAFARKAVSRTK